MIPRVGESSAPPSTWFARPLVLGLGGVLLLGVVYPLVDGPTQQPLGIFVIPILITCALGTWVETLVVCLAALGVALVEAAVQGDFDTTGLAARLSIMAMCGLVAIVVAFERGRRELIVEETVSRGLLLDLFQDSLVPEPIPPPGVTVETRYLPGDERLQLGGDFFDAIRLPNGSLGYIIGDVCGQGPRAAAFGASVRSGWKTLAMTAPDDPLHWVEGLDEAFFRLGRHTDTFVTLNTGLIDLDHERRWWFVSAGHPWPVLLCDGVEVVEPHVGPPLGIGIVSAWQQTERVFPKGGVVMLYTDGLIENASSHGSRGDGERRLLEHLRKSGLDIEELLRAFGPEGFDDDVAVLTIAVDADQPD
jgi:hypothetical protein